MSMILFGLIHECYAPGGSQLNKNAHERVHEKAFIDERHTTFEHLLITLAFGAVMLTTRNVLIKIHPMFKEVPSTAFFFVAGVIRQMICILFIKDSLHILGYNKHEDATYLSFVLIPMMLGVDSLFMNMPLLKSNWKQVLCLVVIGFGVGAVLTVVFMKYLMDWDWAQAGSFASIVTCTDPVAVIPILQSVGVNENLTMWVAGESLFNDGVAVVVFKNFMAALHDPLTVGGILISGCQLVGGGIAVGLVFAIIQAVILKGFLGVSGILAVVIYGCTTSLISPAPKKVQKHIHETLEVIVEFMQMIMFQWCGMFITYIAKKVPVSQWFYVPVIYIALYIIRMIAVGASYFVLKLQDGFSPKWMMVCAHGGLRGGLSLFLAMELIHHEAEYHPEPFSYARVAAFHISMFVMLTTLVNAPSMTRLISLMGVETNADAERQSVKTVDMSDDERNEKAMEKDALEVTENSIDHV